MCTETTREKISSFNIHTLGEESWSDCAKSIVSQCEDATGSRKKRGGDRTKIWEFIRFFAHSESLLLRSSSVNLLRNCRRISTAQHYLLFAFITFPLWSKNNTAKMLSGTAEEIGRGHREERKVRARDFGANCCCRCCIHSRLAYFTLVGSKWKHKRFSAKL